MDPLDDLISQLRAPLYVYNLTIHAVSDKRDTPWNRGARKRNLRAKLQMKDLITTYAARHSTSSSGTNNTVQWADTIGPKV